MTFQRPMSASKCFSYTMLSMISYRIISWELCPIIWPYSHIQHLNLFIFIFFEAFFTFLLLSPPSFAHYATDEGLSLRLSAARFSLYSYSMRLKQMKTILNSEIISIYYLLNHLLPRHLTIILIDCQIITEYCHRPHHLLHRQNRINDLLKIHSIT